MKYVGWYSAFRVWMTEWWFGLPTPGMMDREHWARYKKVFRAGYRFGARSRDGDIEGTQNHIELLTAMIGDQGKALEDRALQLQTAQEAWKTKHDELVALQAALRDPVLVHTMILLGAIRLSEEDAVQEE